MPPNVDPNSELGRFASRVRELRSRLGYSQQDLADLMGVSRSHLADVENLRSKPGGDLIIGLANFKPYPDGNGPRLSREWLLAGAGDMLTTDLRVESFSARGQAFGQIDTDSLFFADDLVTSVTAYCLGAPLKGRKRYEAAVAVYEKMQSAHFGPRDDNRTAAEAAVEAAFRTVMPMVVLLQQDAI